MSVTGMEFIMPDLYLCIANSRIIKVCNYNRVNSSEIVEDLISTPTPTPTPELLTKDLSATRSRMEILPKENLVGAKTTPIAISRPFTPSQRENRFP